MFYIVYSSGTITTLLPELYASLLNCICTGINNTSFSNKVDESGYPIAGSISLVLQGVIPPTFSGTRADLVTLRFGGF